MSAFFPRPLPPLFGLLLASLILRLLRSVPYLPRRIPRHGVVIQDPRRPRHPGRSLPALRQAGSPGEQRDFIVEKFMPIKNKVLGVTQGNHERRIEDVDVAGDIAKALGVPYRAEGMLLKISFGSGNSGHPNKPYVYWGYFTHGYGGARTKSAKAVKVERVGQWLHADFYVMSHDHVVNVSPDIYLLLLLSHHAM